jgi:hypothetical protein
MHYRLRKIKSFVGLAGIQLESEAVRPTISEGIIPLEPL